MRIIKLNNNHGATNNRLLAFELGAKFSTVDKIINWLLGYIKR